MWDVFNRYSSSLIYKGQRIFLKEKYRFSENETYDNVAVVVYSIHLIEGYRKIGEIDLRLTMNDYMYYYGHLGYHIIEKYRGNHYATEACVIIKMLAKTYFNLNELIVTCNPDNYASIKTIERIGGEFIECVNVPEDHDLYLLGEKVKNIYRVKL